MADDTSNAWLGAVYRWVRDGPRPPIALTARCGPDGAWLHGRRQSVATCDEAWWAIWGKNQADTPPNRDWLAHLRTLPPYPAHTRLGREQLRRVLSTYTANKAAGPDGWRISELKLCGPPCLNGWRTCSRSWNRGANGRRP